MKNIKVLVADYEIVESPKRMENEEKAYDNGAENVCVCCGKEIKDEMKAKSIHLIEGGAYLTESEEDFGNGDMCWFSIGPSCYKKFLKNKKEIEIKIED